MSKPNGSNVFYRLQRFGGAWRIQHVIILDQKTVKFEWVGEQDVLPIILAKLETLLIKSFEL